MGEFSFTTTEEGIYVACFRADGHNSSGRLTASIDWKTGISTKDWESVARVEKIEVTFPLIRFLLLQNLMVSIRTHFFCTWYKSKVFLKFFYL